MSDGLGEKKDSISNIRGFLQAPVKNSNSRRELTAEETKRLSKMEAIAEKLKRGKNVQNRQLQTWLSDGEYEQFEYEWQGQLELRNEFKDKPSELKRYEEKLREATFNFKRAEGYSSNKNTLLLRNSATIVQSFVKMR